MNYYNDADPHACHRLRSLISAGLIPAGHVDQRSIADVRPADLVGFVQCHFFAGIGGWPEALRLAEVRPDVPLWTGSCPCQPFSSAGQRRGTEDERHLWPVFRDLIAECRPAAVFGEQVASADGRAWLDVVRAEMEALGYAVGAADLCAAGVGAPHIRQRLYFVGMADAVREQRHRCGNERKTGWLEPAICRSVGRMADTNGDGCEPRAGNDPAPRHGNPTASEGIAGGLADSPCRLNQSGSTRSDQRAVESSNGAVQAKHRDSCPPDGFWRDADWLWCRDGKWRPVESGTFPLAHGLPGRVAHLRGYGNAIVPQVAATFIRAALASE